jgi:hypothetical protein
MYIRWRVSSEQRPYSPGDTAPWRYLVNNMRREMHLLWRFSYLMDHSSKTKLPKILVYTGSCIYTYFLHRTRHYRAKYKWTLLCGLSYTYFFLAFFFLSNLGCYSWKKSVGINKHITFFWGICCYSTRPYVVLYIAWNILYIHIFAVKLMAESLESFTVALSRSTNRKFASCVKYDEGLPMSDILIHASFLWENSVGWCKKVSYHIQRTLC